MEEKLSTLSDRRYGSYCIGRSEKAKHDRRSSTNKQQDDRQYCSLNPAENQARQSVQNEVLSSTVIVIERIRLLVRISDWQQFGLRSRMLPLRSAKHRPFFPLHTKADPCQVHPSL
jgi:hypothetical protein